MSQYTSGTNRLHMAYTFDYLGGEFSAAHFRRSIAETERAAPDGWIEAGRAYAADLTAGASPKQSGTQSPWTGRPSRWPWA